MVIRVSLTLDPVDVELVDRLAASQGINRSEQFRQFLAQARPMLRQTVEVLEAAQRQRDELLETFSEAELTGLAELLPEVERVQGTILGSMARLEGAMAAQAAMDPRSSNHGGQVSTPPSEETPE